MPNMTTTKVILGEDIVKVLLIAGTPTMTRPGAVGDNFGILISRKLCFISRQFWSTILLPSGDNLLLVLFPEKVS